MCQRSHSVPAYWDWGSPMPGHEDIRCARPHVVNKVSADVGRRRLDVGIVVHRGLAKLAKCWPASDVGQSRTRSPSQRNVLLRASQQRDGPNPFGIGGVLACLIGVPQDLNGCLHVFDSWSLGIHTFSLTPSTTAAAIASQRVPLDAWFVVWPYSLVASSMAPSSPSPHLLPLA